MEKTKHWYRATLKGLKDLEESRDFGDGQLRSLYQNKRGDVLALLTLLVGFDVIRVTE